jgi:NAD(P)-dependent dehydrogenase (short-subunit alcohol dehydrogenase family)
VTTDSRRDFTGKIAVVTGAGSGIGRATALLLARLGATVHLGDLDGDAAERVKAEIGGATATAHAVDVTDPAAVEALADRVFAADAAVDVLHNNAGIGHGGRVEDTTLEDWQRVLGVNLMGTVHGVHFFVPRMLRQGRPAHVVNTASGLGLLAGAQLAPYCTSKFGVVGMSEALNAELSPRGIRVTALCPGIIDTPITQAAIMRGDLLERTEATQDFYRRRGASAETVAEAAVDAIRKGTMIRTVPRSHVDPGWIVKRISPRASQVLSRHMSKLITGRNRGSTGSTTTSSQYR